MYAINVSGSIVLAFRRCSRERSLDFWGARSTPRIFHIISTQSLLVPHLEVHIADGFDAHLLSGAEGDLVIANALHALEVLGAVHEPPLVIAPGVDEVGVVERQLSGAVHDVVRGLDTEHERVVLVADLVLPAAEAATAEDVAVLELRQELLQHAIALKGWSRVAVVEAAVVGRYNLVVGLKHVSVDETLNGILEKCVVVDGFLGGFGDLKHDGPVGTWLRGGGLALGWPLTVCELNGGEGSLL